MRLMTTPLGVLCLQAYNGAMIQVCTVDVPDMPDISDTEAEQDVTCSVLDIALLDEAVAQIEAYMHGRLQHFSLPLAPQGTPFMQAVWRALCAVPYGQTQSYGQIATAIGQAKASRAVGMACRRNPLLLLVPCHRIIGSSGKLVGFQGNAEHGLVRKQALLALEQGQRILSCHVGATQGCGVLGTVLS